MISENSECFKLESCSSFLRRDFFIYMDTQIMNKAFQQHVYTQKIYEHYLIF